MRKYVWLICLLTAILLSGCGRNGQMAEDVNLTEVHGAVKEAYGDDYIPNMLYDSRTISELFGLNEDMYEEIIAEGPMMSFSADTFVAVRAKEGKSDEVREALESYRSYLINDSFQYPTNMIKVQASRVEQRGNYVFFILLGTIPAQAEEQGENAVLQAAREQNKVAVDIIDSFFK